ncbi:hypothetical protein Acr_06g0008160 [Actinidia rufa]|uniref:Uncharacterized protein n=1 Tax=Actinidia rufa TaxID=165716 RepID=A0A7J0ERP7_9ERIC|nr:hypothetical protein Acr_06g0008160 [Actinidia rufa]
MSSRNDLGDDLEDSLPSWVSKHLRERPMSDETNQQPTSPRGAAFPRDPLLGKTLPSTKIPRGLYSLLKSPGPDSGWLYFKARWGRNLLKGSSSNVKGWKTRFFFVSGDAWEFFLSMPLGEGIPLVTRSWGPPGKHYNKLPILNRVEEKRLKQVLSKIEPKGYYDVLAVLGSRTFQCFFTHGHSEVSFSGWVNDKSGDTEVTASGEEGESRLPRDELRASMMSSAPMAEKFLSEVILPVNKEKVAQFSTNQLLSKAFHALGQGVVLMSALALWVQDCQNDFHFQLARVNTAELEMAKAQSRAREVKNLLAAQGKQAMKTEAELKEKFKTMARLEAEVTKLTGQLAHSKELAVEEFRSSDDFKVVVTDFASAYLSEGFEFCKRKLVRHHPNLGIDWASMKMDTNLAEE